MDANQNKRYLYVYRRRMGYTQRQVADLLNLESTEMLSRYEHGHSLPPLVLALQLGALYRAPVEFLFHELYQKLRQEIRISEAAMGGPALQGVLF